MKKVFLGGTTNETTWREELIEMLEIDYFNPVVDDWDEAAQQRELRERKTCDFCLYTITPKMIGVYSIAEVVDDSNKQPKKTVLIILKTDGKDKFDKHQWKSIDRVRKMVKNNGSKTFDSLKSAAIWMNNVQK